MSTSELELLLRRLLGEGVQLQAAVYVFITAVSLITAGLGAYFGAYFQRRGEHLATKADFDSIMQQLTRQTKEVEDIKSEIARAGWVHQRRWELARDLYVDLLKILEEIRQKGRWLRRAVGEYPYPSPDTDRHVKMFADHMQERGTVDKLLAAKALAGVVLPQHVVMVIERLSDEYNFALDRFLGIQDSVAILEFLRDNVEGLLRETDLAYETVLRESQHQLLD